MRTTGVYQMLPRSHAAFSYKTSIDMGEVPVDAFFKANKPGGQKLRGSAYSAAYHNSISFDRDIWPVLEDLMDKYRANQYDMLLKNCNHFSDDFVRRLFAGTKGIDNYLNRAAWVGSFFHCLVPARYLQVTPPGCEEEAAALAEECRREEEEEAARQREYSSRAPTLAELSTRETEMSATSASASNSLKAKDGDSGLIDSFYRSLTGR